MSSSDDKRAAIARVYAGSLLDLAHAADRADAIQEQLEGLAGLVAEDADLATFLESPLVGTAERSASLEKMFRGRLDDLLVDTLHIMHRKGRLALVQEVAAAYRRALRDRLGRVEVRVASAVPLGDAVRQELLAVLRDQTGLEPVLDETVDPALLGGLVLRIGDRKIDGSVRRHIRKIRDRLLERAAHQILQSRAARA